MSVCVRACERVWKWERERERRRETIIVSESGVIVAGQLSRPFGKRVKQEDSKTDKQEKAKIAISVPNKTIDWHLLKESSQP